MIGLGPWTLFVKEARRYLRVPGQTVLSPAVTACLYLLVFGVALGGRLRTAGGVPYLEFVAPGLVMLGVVSNSFLNTSSSMMGMKMQGTIIDLLVTPLGHGQIVLAMVAAAVTRALLVGVVTWLVAVAAVGGVRVAHPGYAMAFPLLAAVGMGAVGLLTGIWADKFEKLNAVPTFVLTPLTFLGGVFYDVRSLPGHLATASSLNPILYLVEGMRYGLTGRSAADPVVGLAFLAVVDCVALGLAWLALASGWKLRG